MSYFLKVGHEIIRKKKYYRFFVYFCFIIHDAEFCGLNISIIFQELLRINNRNRSLDLSHPSRFQCSKVNKANEKQISF